MSPEQACEPSPPAAGCSPASTRARPTLSLQETPSKAEASARKVTTAVSGFFPVLRFERCLESLEASLIHILGEAYLELASIEKTAFLVIIDQTSGLHEGVADRRADKFEAAA
jgi:hypothetical protein